MRAGGTPDGARGHAGLTLIEIMIVVLIIGVLLAIGYPLYQQQVRESRRAEAKQVLQRVMQAQEQFRTDNNTYATDLDGAIGFDNDPVRSRPADWYRVSAAACGGGIATCVALTATPQGDQANDDCNAFTLDSRGIRGVTGAASVDDCW